MCEILLITKYHSFILCFPASLLYFYEWFIHCVWYSNLGQTTFINNVINKTQKYNKYLPIRRLTNACHLISGVFVVVFVYLFSFFEIFTPKLFLFLVRRIFLYTFVVVCKQTHTADIEILFKCYILDINIYRYML